MPGDLQSSSKRELSDDAASPDLSDGKKRRTAGSSSRSVSSLSKEQLEKKRANDREAQRAIRERTKNQIENLERKIRDLVSQQPYQDLQNVLRQKEAVEAENAEIKKSLAAVLSIIQPVLSAPQQHSESLYSSPPQTYIPIRPGSASNQHGSGSHRTMSPNSASNAQWTIPTGQPPLNDTRDFVNDRRFNQQRHDLAHGLQMGPERLGLEFLLDGSQRINKLHNGMNSAEEPLQYQQSQPRGNGVSQDHNRSHSRDNGPPHMGFELNSHGGELAAHATPIRNSPPTCPLDNILLDFLHERQQQAADGAATPSLVGPAYPSVSSLLNPAHSVNSHPLSKVFTDILGTFPDLSTLPEKVAVLYIMFLIMRWQISPTQENYDRLPDWVTPRPSQLFTPHPAWIDHIPWPRMRDKLVRDYNPHEYLFDNFFIPFTTTLSLNWPYEPTDTLLSSADSDELMINPVFERHLRRSDNWTLGVSFVKAFPGLTDTFNVKGEGDRR